jgi:hypothetical protein
LKIDDPVLKERHQTPERDLSNTQKQVSSSVPSKELVSPYNANISENDDDFVTDGNDLSEDELTLKNSK